MRPLISLSSFQNNLEYELKQKHNLYSTELTILQNWFKVNAAIINFQNEANLDTFKQIFEDSFEHYVHMFFEVYEKDFTKFIKCFTTKERDILLFYILKYYN